MIIVYIAVIIVLFILYILYSTRDNHILLNPHLIDAKFHIRSTSGKYLKNIDGAAVKYSNLILSSSGDIFRVLQTNITKAETGNNIYGYALNIVTQNNSNDGAPVEVLNDSNGTSLIKIYQTFKINEIPYIQFIIDGKYISCCDNVIKLCQHSSHSTKFYIEYI